MAVLRTIRLRPSPIEQRRRCSSLRSPPVLDSRSFITGHATVFVGTKQRFSLFASANLAGADRGSLQKQGDHTWVKPGPLAPMCCAPWKTAPSASQGIAASLNLQRFLNTNYSYESCETKSLDRLRRRKGIGSLKHAEGSDQCNFDGTCLSDYGR